MALTRGYGSMPSLVSIAVHESNNENSPARTNSWDNRERAENERNRKQVALELPTIRQSAELPAKNCRSASSTRESISSRKPKLNHQQNIGGEHVTTSLNTVKLAINEVRFTATPTTEWPIGTASRTKFANTNLRARISVKEEGKSLINATKAKKTTHRRKALPPQIKISQTYDGHDKYSDVLSLERELYFQDCREKCLQWLKTLPDGL